MLLDTHALYWLVSGTEPLRDEALIAIGESQAANRLFVSPITAWELAIAAQKAPTAGRPHLGAEPPATWFRKAVKATTARLLPIQSRIALQAAELVTRTGHKDPGDCYLMATAMVHKVPLITRDAAIRTLADKHPGLLKIVQC